MKIEVSLFQLCLFMYKKVFMHKIMQSIPSQVVGTRQTDLQTYRIHRHTTEGQADRQTEGQADRQTDKQTDRQEKADRQTDRQGQYRQKDRRTDRRKHRQTDRQTDGQTEGEAREKNQAAALALFP